jgi:hypothetical protein
MTRGRVALPAAGAYAKPDGARSAVAPQGH